MEKATQFREALVGETRARLQTAVIEGLIAEAEEKLAELGLKVEDLQLRAKSATGKVVVKWDVGGSRFSETFELRVQVPILERRKPETEDDLQWMHRGATLRILASAFREAGYEACITVVSEGYVYQREPREACLDIPIARRGEFEAFLSLRI